jgi:hypothetical protein
VLDHNAGRASEEIYHSLAVPPLPPPPPPAASSRHVTDTDSSSDSVWCAQPAGKKTASPGCSTTSMNRRRRARGNLVVVVEGQGCTLLSVRCGGCTCEGAMGDSSGCFSTTDKLQHALSPPSSPLEIGRADVDAPAAPQQVRPRVRVAAGKLVGVQQQHALRAGQLHQEGVRGVIMER